MAIKVKVKPKKGRGSASRIKAKISGDRYIGDETQRLGVKADSLETKNRALLKTIDSLKVEIKIQGGAK